MRTLGSFVLGVYLFGALASPLVHVFRDHSSGAIADAQKIDPDQFRDPVTGHVDLNKLAEAMGLGHDESNPHSHGPGGHPGEHGANAIEHFGLAMLAAADAAIVVVGLSPADPEPRTQTCASRVLTMRHLTAQRSTAPPGRT